MEFVKSRSTVCRSLWLALRLSLLVVLFLQAGVTAALADKDVYVRWGTTSWNGVGGSVSAPGKSVSNNNNVWRDYNDHATVTFEVTPDTGYVISSVEWKHDDDDGFAPGTGTAILTPDVNGRYSFTLNDRDSSFQVTFALSATAQKSVIAYYGTNAFDFTSANPPDWGGGRVYRMAGGGPEQLGTSSYLVSDWSFSGDKTIRVIPGTAPNFTVASVKYSVATWQDPRNITLVGSWTTVSPDSNGDFILPATGTNSYVIYVQFAPAGAVGGNIGAWYGTNNTTAYDTPNANGNGGTVVKTSPGSTVTLANRAVNGVTVTTNSTVTFEVRPAANYKITSIMYGDTAPINAVAVPANQTTNMTFSFDVAGGHTYVIWVVFTSTAASSFVVTGTVDPATDALCTANDVSPSPQTININQTGSFNLSTSTNCQIDCVNFNSGGCIAWGGTGTTYTTPPITAISNFTVKFKPIGYTIDAIIDPSSPSGSGTITPAGAVATGNAIQVAQASSQGFTITANTGYSIAHVYVTDANKSWTNHDLVPMAGDTYTFTNIQANGSIKVHFVANVPASGYDYCQIPPFVQGRSDLIPNVLVVFDNSGSMGGNDSDGFAYYNRKSYSCTAAHNATTNLCSTIFYGYFDPYKMYKTDSGNSNVYLINNVTLNLSNTNGLSGNYLNWRNMNKVDVIRKVLVGGRVTAKASSTLAGSSRGTIATKYLYTDNGKWVEYGTTEPRGLIQEYADRVRFGLEVFGSTSNATNDGGTIVAKLGSPIATMVAAVEGSKTNPTTSTPIAEALYEAIRYYQAKPSAYNSSTDYGDTTWNPTTSPIIQYPCQKHFVLLLTDGEANSTDKLPGLTNPTMNSYTDGVFNVNTWVNRLVAADKPASSDGKYVDGVGYYAHVTDLRSSSYGNDIAGTQTIAFYTVYAFGDGSGTKTLQSLSKYGGFENKNGNDAGTDPNKYPSPDQVNEWDLNADNVPDTYFEGDDGAIIGAKLIEAIKSMIAKVSSGTAASILANSEGSGANLLQAIFYPNKIFDAQTEANWTGELHNLWYYIDPFVSNSTVREDTDYVSGNTHYLNLTSDYVVNYYFDGTATAVNLSMDADANGSGETSISTGVSPDAVKSIWRAGRNLWAMNAGDRKIYTACSIKDATCLACLGAAGCPGGVTDSGMMAFTTANKAVVGNYLQAADAATAETIIDYVRGVDVDNYRKRTVTLTTPSGTNVWKLGDIISSTPRLQSNMKLNSYDLPQPAGYGDTSYGSERYKKGFIYGTTYKNRGMVFAGANDGMLHAFKLGILDVTASGDRKATLTGTDLGQESWAFIPSSALPYLKYMGDPAYGDKFHVN